MGKINSVKGCLIEEFEKGTFNVMIQGLNCQSTQNSGVAKSIREKYPQVYEDDCNFIGAPEEKLGKFVVTKIDEKRIVGLYSQLRYGYEGERYVNYEAFYKSLSCLRDCLTHSKKTWSVGLPYKIASDRGGAAWSIIKSMILDIFKKTDIDVYIVKYNK